MLARIKDWASRVSSSLWFIPGLMVLSSVLLAIGMIAVDYRISRAALIGYPRLFGASAESSRALLAAIAGSMITVAGVTFSITVVAVSQASAQYSSRILRNFMRDRWNQVVLGVFVGVFTYCLVIARTIRGADDILFIPAISSLVAFVLAIVALGFLIFFIHHIAESLEAANLLQRIRRETARAIDRLFPKQLAPDEESRAGAVFTADNLSWCAVASDRTGYIQSVDVQALLRIAEDVRAVIRMEHLVGEFVVEGSPIASVAQTHNLDPRTSERVNRAHIVMPYRTVQQDIAFGFRQIVDIALKALSPAVNDPTTAVACIDHLSALLSGLAPRRLAESVLVRHGRPLVLACGPSFGDLLDAAFNEIRRSGAGNVAILERMLGALATIGAFTTAAERRAKLRRHVELIAEIAARTVAAEHDKQAIADRCHEVAVSLS